jgi:hypothetical protein
MDVTEGHEVREDGVYFFAGYDKNEDQKPIRPHSAFHPDNFRDCSSLDSCDR